MKAEHNVAGLKPDEKTFSSPSDQLWSILSYST